MIKIDIPFKLYFVASTLIATCICGGINTFSTYILYMGKEDETSMWAWPSTVAGDVVVTIITTAIITWILSSQLTMLDMSKEKPLHVTHKPKLESLPVKLHPLARRAQVSLLSRTNFFNNLLQHVLVGTVLGLILTPVIGTPFVVAGYYLTDDEWPMKTLLIYKGVLGGLLGFLLQPFIVLMAAAKPDDDSPEKQLQEEDSSDAVDVEEGDNAETEEASEK